ncbi:MAG TPA: S8 family serine peptidase, partial [Polyangiaceae bacterium]|nr:S8 family serine peptidase [Polyangiaceae bacterium]
MSSRKRAGWGCSLAGSLGLLGGLTLVRPAHADLPARPLIEAARRDVGLSRIFDVGVERWLVRVPNEQAARAAGLVPVSPSWAVARGTAESMLELERRATDFQVRWSPGLRPLLDQAGETVRAVEVHDDLGLSGQGVIVGVIDTGADLTHSALRRADGTTRVAWLLSFDLGPQGLHPELEEAYGCVEDDSCGILNAADIDEILAGGLPGPRDRVGHGTHVTSTAAGSAGIYGGMAPESEVVIVQSGSSTGSLRDPDILLGARFIYDRAAEETKPAVINISLGSSFGAHDGGSSLEDGLAELAQGPGRLMVVAGGNDGSLYDSGSSDYPAPFGVHSEVTVPVDGQVRVSLLTPESQRDLVQGSMYLWIGLEQDDEMSVRFDTLRGGITSPVGPGQAAGFTSQGLHEQGDTDYELSIFNGQDGDDGSDYVRPG